MGSVDQEDSDGPMRRATLRCGVASLTATAERAPFIQHAKQARRSPLRFDSALKGRGAVRDMRLPPRGHDQPRWRRGRATAHRGTSSGALGHARRDAR
ncbi:DUF6380 family protein [Streptomyces sp. Ag109_G2-15]|uniref:DUF6380 family protein n=1 Tax=Streptomyces sp. Ag109_G2-15 TaxID=1938850 RepID=UPI00359C75A0